MDLRAHLTASLLLVGASLLAQTPSPTVIGLYNTGALVDGATPYILQSSPSGNPGAVGLYEPESVVWPIEGVWMNNTESTQWLAVGFSNTTPTTPRVPSVAAGDYTIRLNFSLGIYDPATVGFTIRAAADNSLSVRLNGIVLPNFGLPSGDVNYSSLASYSYTVAGLAGGLQAGANWLDFVVTNALPTGDNPAGLYVTFSDFVGTPVPEPSTYALLLGLSTGALVFWRRRRRC